MINASRTTIAILLALAIALLAVALLKNQIIGIITKDEERTLSFSSLSELSIKTDSGDLYIYPTEEDSITVRSIKAKSLTVKESGSTIAIDHKAGRFKTSVLELYIPTQAFKSLECSSVSGNIDIATISLSGALSPSSVSGEIKLRQASADNIHIKTISGAIEGSNLSSSAIKAESISGDIDLTMAKAEKIVLSTTSGDIDQNSGTFTSLSATTASGNINIYTSDKGYDVAISKTSGYVELFNEGINTEVRNSNSFNRAINASSISGNIKIAEL